MAVVEKAAIGDLLTVNPVEWVRWLEGWRQGVAESADLVLKASSAERARMMDEYDAAERLLEGLAGAVA